MHCLQAHMNYPTANLLSLNWIWLSLLGRLFFTFSSEIPMDNVKVQQRRLSSISEPKDFTICMLQWTDGLLKEFAWRHQRKCTDYKFCKSFQPNDNVCYSSPTCKLTRFVMFSTWNVPAYAKLKSSMPVPYWRRKVSWVRSRFRV